MEARSTKSIAARPEDLWMGFQDSMMDQRVGEAEIKTVNIAGVPLKATRTDYGALVHAQAVFVAVKSSIEDYPPPLNITLGVKWFPVRGTFTWRTDHGSVWMPLVAGVDKEEIRIPQAFELSLMFIATARKEDYREILKRFAKITRHKPVSAGGTYTISVADLDAVNRAVDSIIDEAQEWIPRFDD